MKQVIVLCLILASARHTNAQETWMTVKENTIKVSGKRQIIPQKYSTFLADMNLLKNRLSSAPNDKVTPINLSACIIELPLPSGNIQRFRVVNSPVMADDLSAAYPDIKTFSVKGIDDPYASGKLDMNEFGFHGMVFSPGGDYFIDPYCLGNTNSYISYYTADFVKPVEDMLPEVGLIEDEEGSQKKPAASTNNAVGAKASAPPAGCIGTKLRTYRLAVACTGEYAIAATGNTNPTVAQTLAKIVTSVNRVNGVYEKELSIRLVLVPSQTLIIYTSGNADPFNNTNANTLIGQSQTVISASIGATNFDVGHTFSTGGGGLANLGCVCQPNNKARGITGSPNPVGDPYDIDYVAHEMGHQFGGEHTFNAGTGSCAGNRSAANSVEPGSGITIMGYAGICGSTDNLGNNSIPYFHAVSYDQIINNVTSGVASGCAVQSATGNNPPVLSGTSGQVVPVSTPFYLTGSATDPDGDPLTYSWEETDPGASTASWNSGGKPYFMSYAPITTGTRFFPKASVALSGNFTGTRGEYLPTTAQYLSFRLTARDNKMGGGGVCYSNILVNIDGFGPFKVTYPSATGIVWPSASTQNISWDVNGTNLSPIGCDSVRILYSFSSGNTYSVLVGSTPNDGVETINVPTVPNTITTCRIKIESKGNVFYDIGDNNFTISNGTISDVGFKEISTNNSLGLFAWPNPSHDVLYVELGRLNAENETILILSDVLGKEVMKLNYQNQAFLKSSIDVSTLPNGVYFLKAKNGDNQSAYRLIKN